MRTHPLSHVSSLSRLLTLLLVACCSLTGLAQSPLYHCDFENGSAEGWRMASLSKANIDYLDQTRIQPVTHQPAGGNPGGCITLLDRHDGL
jgi:hypothetical protein